MGTKSNRSSGTQITPKGVNQGTVLVDPTTGLPIDIIPDTNGIKRLAVDANFVAQNVQATVQLLASEDSVRVEDPNTGAHIRVENDGTINVNAIIDSTSDNILVLGTENGTKTGIQHVLKVPSDGLLRVQDDLANTKLDTLHSDLVVVEGKQDTGNSSLASIDSKLTTTNSNLLTIDTDLNSFKTANHSDLTTLHSDNVTIEGKIDTVNTNLGTLHSDLTTIDTDIKVVQGTPGSAVPSKSVAIAGKDGSSNLQTIAVTTSGHPIVEGTGTIGLPSGGILTIQGAGGSTASPVIVSGAAAVGATPINNPVPISGVDGGGLKRSFLTDTSGRQQILVNDTSGNGITSHSLGSQRGLDTSIVDGPQLDSYNRLRTAGQDIAFSVDFCSSLNSLHFNTQLTGSGTLTSFPNNAAARLTTTTNSTDSVVLQSRKFFNYDSGISHVVYMSGIVGSKKANVRQRWGYFSTNDGLFFEQTSTDLAVVIRSSTSGSPVDTRIVQSSWNLDKLDGTGPSGINLDTSKHNIYTIDFVWMGGGRIRFGVMNGQGVVYFHQISNGNVNTSPYIRSPSRPIRIELSNLGTTASSTVMDIVCLTLIKETSGIPFAPNSFSASRGTPALSITTLVPLLSIRPKLTFNGITNRIPIDPLIATVQTDKNAIYVQVILNPTLTGATFNSVNANSSVEFDIAATATTGGTLLMETYVSSGSNGQIDLVQLSDTIILGLNIAGTTADILTIAANSLTTGTNAWAALSWQEFQ